jgi:hypothetical protein
MASGGYTSRRLLILNRRDEMLRGVKKEEEAFCEQTSTSTK